MKLLLFQFGAIAVHVRARVSSLFLKRYYAYACTVAGRRTAAATATLDSPLSSQLSALSPHSLLAPSPSDLRGAEEETFEERREEKPSARARPSNPTSTSDSTSEFIFTHTLEALIMQHNEQRATQLFSQSTSKRREWNPSLRCAHVTIPAKVAGCLRQWRSQKVTW